MGIFSVSPARTWMAQAREAFHQGDHREALKHLRQGFLADADHRPLYHLASDCMGALNRQKEAHLFQVAHDEFRNPDAFFVLGNHFNHNNQFEIATPFLQRAIRLQPNHHRALLELSVALSSRFQIREAIQVLQSAESEQHFWTAFQLHYLQILAGHPVHAEEFIDHSRQKCQVEGADKCGQHLSYLVMLERILERYRQLKQPKQHIRDWHFIQYGSAILHYFEEGEDWDAGGRYFAHWTLPQTVRTVLEMAKIWLENHHKKIQLVVSPHDLGSEILGRAMAEVLGIPFSHVGQSRPGSLIVVADNRLLNGMDCLEWIKQNQVVFALNLNWLEGQRYVPDICGWMSQQTTHYWDGGGLTFDAKTQCIKESEADSRNPTEIAQDILSFEPELGAKERETLAFYQPFSDFTPGNAHHSGYRGHFTPTSPIPGPIFS